MTFARRTSATAIGLAAALTATLGSAAVPEQGRFRHRIANDMSKCHAGAGPAVMVTVDGIASSTGNIRVQSYPATEADWLARGHWLSRIEMPAQEGTMTFCLPVPGPGSYAIAVRHDKNANGKTDLTADGGGMSNNPGINIFNLGRPSYRKTAIAVGDGVKSIRIAMRYML